MSASATQGGHNKLAAFYGSRCRFVSVICLVIVALPQQIQDKSNKLSSVD